MDRGDTAPLEESLEKMEAELEASYIQLGKSLMEFAEDEKRGIDALVDEIIRTREQLSAARGEIRCPECMTYNAPRSYCRRCGAPINEQEERKDEDGNQEEQRCT